MVAHDAQRIELEMVLFLAFPNRVEQYLLAFLSQQAKLAIVTANGDVVAVVGFEFTRFSWHLRGVEVGLL